MKNGIALLALVAISLLFISCGEDAPPKSKVGFDEAEMEVFESDGTTTSFHPILLNGATGHDITIEIKLDRPVAETSVIRLTVDGNASTETTASAVADYKFVSDDDNLIIEKGEDSAEITLTIYEDTAFELDNSDNLFETVEITLETVVSGTAVLDPDASTFTLKIFEDDAVVFLDWDDGTNSQTPTRGDVDMDTFLFLDGETVTGSASGPDNDGKNPYEAFNISASYPNGNYGLSFTYYSGTSDDLEFYSVMYNFGGTMNGRSFLSFDDDPLEFVGNYKLKNINKYDAEGGSDPVVVQTMTKNGFNYSNISQINEPATGSRLGVVGNGPGIKMIKSKLSQSQIEGILRRVTR